MSREKFTNGPQMFAGLKLVIVPPRMTTRNRSWKERLFTLPWRPTVKTEEVLMEVIPDGQMIRSATQIMINSKTYWTIQKVMPGPLYD